MIDALWRWWRGPFLGELHANSDGTARLLVYRHHPAGNTIAYDRWHRSPLGAAIWARLRFGQHFWVRL